VLHFLDYISPSSLRMIYSLAGICLRLLRLTFHRLHIAQLIADDTLVGERFPQAFKYFIL